MKEDNTHCLGLDNVLTESHSRGLHVHVVTLNFFTKVKVKVYGTRELRKIKQKQITTYFTFFRLYRVVHMYVLCVQFYHYCHELLKRTKYHPRITLIY